LLLTTCGAGLLGIDPRFDPLRNEPRFQKLVALPTPKAANCLGNSPSDETKSSVIRIYDEAGNLIEMHKHAGDFKEFRKSTMRTLHSSLAVTETQKRKETQ
jgi:hypothetical protein